MHGMHYTAATALTTAFWTVAGAIKSRPQDSSAPIVVEVPGPSPPTELVTDGAVIWMAPLSS